MGIKIVCTLLVASICTAFPQVMFANEETEENAAIVTYEKDYFTSFNPVTLLDMLQAVPGVPDILNKNEQQNRRAQFGGGGGQRGFGSSGDQILMDGKRLAGKANSISDTLARISASQVERIELIRGAASGLDVQSQGLVVNVVMAGGTSNSTTFWQLKGEYSGGHQFEPEGLISHSGSRGSFDYSLSYEYQNNDFFFNSSEEFYDPTGVQTATQTIAGLFDRFGHKFSTNISYDFDDGSRIRLNGLYEPNGNTGVETRSKTSRTLDPIVWLTDRRFKKWEVGGDYSRNAGVLGNLKSLFVISRNTEDATVDRFKGSGIEKFQNILDQTDVARLEKIIRASLTKTIADGQSLEIGGEVAINTFDKKYDRIERETASVTFVADNSDNVEIKENRYEIFANHSYNITSDMVLQSSLTTEFSKIVADNIFADGSLSRRDTSFTYVKPRINFRYDFTERDQLRFLIEKKVSQLNFNNFVTRFDQQAQIFRFGNTAIRPEQTWDFAVTYEHRLPSDTGSLEGEIFYRKYTDHISTIDFTEYKNFAGNSVDVGSFFALIPDNALRELVDFTAKSGNIPAANGYGVRFKSNLRLGFIGLPDATLSVGYTYERKRTVDQFTGQKRNFDRHSDHTIDYNFRHDIKNLQITYGFEGRIRSDAARYFIDYYWPNSPAMNIKVFVEKTIFTDYKLRFEGEGLTRNRGASTFYDYSDHIRFGELSERQERKSKRPVELRVSIQGTF